MTDPGTVARNLRVTSRRAGEATKLSPLSGPDALIESALDRVAAVTMELPFTDAGDAFATWLAYYRVLARARRLATRLGGSGNELIAMLTPWREPLAAAVVPRHPAGLAWTEAAQLLEQAHVRTLAPGARDRGETDHAGLPTLEAHRRVGTMLVQLVLAVAASGDALSRGLAECDVRFRSAAQRLEACRLLRHTPRLAAAAARWFEKVGSGTDVLHRLRTEVLLHRSRAAARTVS